MSSSDSFDLVFRDARIRGHASLQDIGVNDGRISAIGKIAAGAGRRDEAIGGRLVLPGFVDTHVHLDKSCLLCRCGNTGGGLKGAIAAVSRMKADYTVDDVYARGARTLEMAIAKGTMHMRTHVEVDPRVGLRSFEAMKRLKRDYAFALDLSICVFPQEGLINDAGTEELLEQALAQGADLLGGCPYTDSDPQLHMKKLFAMAVAHDVDLDFHLDFDLDPSWSHLSDICNLTEWAGWQNRVTVGHATKLAAMDGETLTRQIARLAEAGVAVTALPSTDLYLNGREAAFRAPRGIAPIHLLAERGVTVSVASNNILNPFTPYGDGSLLRMANLYANVSHIGPEGFPACFDMITESAARLMRLEGYGIAPGASADLVVMDGVDEAEVFGGLAEPIVGWKRGRKSFVRPAATLFRP
ncbi:cytosine deaminase [Rhizobium subbaraonis]|uniref:Cytosine deaminase n=1 Tax=Rhizobium subbaraonis TaxID=908946 RepID=A0A285U331_9HYPH|nr:amidohydrolase family protein [Rhizobium subbaraonis]SOC36133.1 cytosine deaminase [Rhizobium subbaraonis]